MYGLARAVGVFVWSVAAGCSLPPQTGDHATGREAQPVRASIDCAGFFNLNGVTPFHLYVAPDPDARRSVAAHLWQRLGTIAALGAARARCDMWWGVIEPEHDRWNWEVPDLVIEHASTAGLEVYPILCYGSAWSNGLAPATPQERELFGRYVYNLVSRYRGKVKSWEVWNEPNVRPFWTPTPDAKLYTELLEVAYRQAKQADPGCRVVGMCTAGADYPFIEGAYRHGAARWMDAVSFHHYSDKRDEADLEGEIRRIRRIMARFGDGHKPLLITELGVASGKNEIMKPFSLEDQAAWIVKKHLVALAAGIEQFYYFCLTDFFADPDAIGHWGLLEQNLSPKPSARAYSAMTHRIGPAEYLGRIFDAALDPARGDEADLLLFRREDQLFACGWVRRDGNPLVVRLPADGPVVVDDLYGQPRGTVMPDSAGVACVTLTREPCYITGLSRRAAALTSVTFAPNPVYVSPGESRTVLAVVRNPLDESLTIDLSVLARRTADSAVNVRTPRRPVTVAPGHEKTIPFQVKLDEAAVASYTQRLTLGATQQGSAALDVVCAEPLAITLLMTGPPGAWEAIATVENLSDRVLSGTACWGTTDARSPAPTPFADLSPGGSVSFRSPIRPAAMDGLLRLDVQTRQGLRGGGHLHYWGQPIRAVTPTVDGDPSDWKHVPCARLSPAHHQILPEGGPSIDEDEFGAVVWVAWATDRLFLFADITETTPMVNPHNRQDIWRGDGLELYLGFDGPTLSHQRGPRHWQLCISPGDGGRDPIVWSWNTARPDTPPDGAPVEGAVVAARSSDHGYAMEARIPLAALGERVEPDQSIGFDIALNNLCDREAEAKEQMLMWSGNANNWRDPSAWGTAILLPEGESSEE